MRDIAVPRAIFSEYDRLRVNRMSLLEGKLTVTFIGVAMRQQGSRSVPGDETPEERYPWQRCFAFLPIRVAGRWVWCRSYERRWVPCPGSWTTDGTWDLRASVRQMIGRGRAAPGGEMTGRALRMERQVPGGERG